MDVQLVEVRSDDLPLIDRWLRVGHVRRYRGDSEPNLQRLRKPPVKGNWRALIEADGSKFGLVLWQHPTRQEQDEAGLLDVPESVIDIDTMIGEASLTGRGVGSAAIRLVMATVVADPAAPFVIAASSTAAAWMT